MDEDSLSIKGHWWYPDKPENKISGILTIDSPDSIELKTIGTLISWETLLSQSSDSKEADVILGDDLNGKCITLFKVLRTNMVGHSESTYICQIAIIGRNHFLSEKDAVFTEAKANFSLLEEWLCKSGISSKHDRNVENGTLKFGIEYEEPDNLEYYVKEITAKLSLSYSFNCREIEKNHWFFKQISSFKLSPDYSKGLQWFLKNFEDLRRLFTILIGFPIVLEGVICYGKEIELDPHTRSKEDFYIYIRRNKSFLKAEKKHPSKLLTTFPDLKDFFDNLINNWFGKYEDLNPSVILCVATMSVNLGYAEFSLLNYAQSLESLHRRMFGGKYVSAEEFKPIRKTITESLPDELNDDLRQSLSTRIRYGNEFSQKTRIAALLDEVWEDCLENFIVDKEGFVKRVVDTRNYLIHFDPSLSPRVASGTEIFYLGEKLKIILIANIFIQLGMPREKVVSLINSFSEFNYLKLRNLS